MKKEQDPAEIAPPRQPQREYRVYAALIERCAVRPLGITIECEASEPVLDSALRAGLRLVDYRCAEHDCGGCKALVRHGQVRFDPHADRLLSEDEKAQGHVLLCQTHVKSDLVVELLPGWESPPLTTYSTLVAGS